MGGEGEFTCASDLEDYNNNNFAVLMSGGEIELLSSSAKKIYEFILTAKEPS